LRCSARGWCWNFVALYLLAVNMRILGLVYMTRKRRFGWFER